MVNNLAVAMGTDLAAGVPYYGAAPAAENVAKVKTPCQVYFYEGTHHGFNKNSTPRYA